MVLLSGRRFSQATTGFGVVQGRPAMVDVLNRAKLNLEHFKHAN